MKWAFAKGQWGPGKSQGEETAKGGGPGGWWGLAGRRAGRVPRPVRKQTDGPDLLHLLQPEALLAGDPAGVQPPGPGQVPARDHGPSRRCSSNGGPTGGTAPDQVCTGTWMESQSHKGCLNLGLGGPCGCEPRAHPSRLVPHAKQHGTRGPGNLKPHCPWLC